MDAQEELKSDEVTMHNNHGLGYKRFLTEISKIVRGLAPETQVGLSRYSVTIKLCDSYCLGISDYQVVQ